MTGRASNLEVEELKEMNKELGEINHRQEKRAEDLETKLLHLITYYLLFQGVVLTAISQASSLRCRNWWIPFVISLVSALISGFAIARTALKYTHTKRQLDINRREQDMLRQQINAPGAAGVPDGQSRFLKPDPVKWAWQYAYMGVTMLALLVFTVVILLGCHFVLCDDQSS